MLCLFLFFLAGCNAASVNEFRTYKNHKVLEIVGDKNSLGELIDIMTEKYDVPLYHELKSKIKMLVAAEWLETLDSIVYKRKLNKTVVVDDFSELISQEMKAKRSNVDFGWDGYFDIDDINNFLQIINQEYANWTQIVVGGESYEGREIRGIIINTPVGDDNKPVFFIEAGIHAREWITPAAITYFINQLLTSNDPEIIALRDQFTWHIFPSVNPDGYHYSFTADRMWRKTRSKSSVSCFGADPNRNWDYKWMEKGSSNNPCHYSLYAGSKPFSEIETRTLSNYLASLHNLLFYVAFHSDAQMLLLPYSDSNAHVDNYDDLVAIGKESLRRGFLVNKEKYQGPATAAEILYKVSGGSMDWVRHALGTPLVFTFELRGNNFIWPAERIPEQGDETTQMLLGLAEEARNLGYY